MNIASPSTEASVEHMFDAIAPKYDFFSDLISFGLVRFWRRQVLRQLKKKMTVLDLGCGTGSLTFMAAKRLGGGGHIVGVDVSKQMLSIARQRSQKRNKDGCIECSIEFIHQTVQTHLENHPNAYDRIISAFMLRSLGQAPDLVLVKIYQALKEGGKIALIDMTEPENLWVRHLWKFHMNTSGLIFGKIIFGRKYPANFLVESAQGFARPRDFLEKLKAQGFRNVCARQYFFGNVWLYEAVK